jgi:hypothetical protein
MKNEKLRMAGERANRPCGRFCKQAFTMRAGGCPGKRLVNEFDLKYWRYSFLILNS